MRYYFPKKHFCVFQIIPNSFYPCSIFKTIRTILILFING